MVEGKGRDGPADINACVRSEIKHFPSSQVAVIAARTRNIQLK
jgi:hypothetical protein